MQSDARDDDDVAPLEEGVRGGVAEPVDLVVARRVLLDVRVRAREVGLRLVVVEVAHEVLDRVLGEELAELGVELGCQGLVVGEDERRLVVGGDGPGEGGRLPGARGSEQRLVADAPGEAIAQALDRGGLVAGRLEGGDELEVRHARSGYRIDGCRTSVRFGSRPFAMRPAARLGPVSPRYWARTGPEWPTDRRRRRLATLIIDGPAHQIGAGDPIYARSAEDTTGSRVPGVTESGAQGSNRTSARWTPALRRLDPTCR